MSYVWFSKNDENSDERSVLPRGCTISNRCLLVSYTWQTKAFFVCKAWKTKVALENWSLLTFYCKRSKVSFRESLNQAFHHFCYWKKEFSPSFQYRNIIVRRWDRSILLESKTTNPNRENINVVIYTWNQHISTTDKKEKITFTKTDRFPPKIVKSNQQLS